MEQSTDQRMLSIMRMRIIKIEKDNAKDKKYSDSEMVKEIQKIIEEEADAI